MIQRSEFAKTYLQELQRVLSVLPIEPLASAMDLIEATYTEGKNIFLIGNGGSAATASHMANDLTWALSRRNKTPVRAMALTDNVSLMTAIANDSSYDDIFRVQLEALGGPGDLVVAISGSGNSPNVVKGVEAAKRKGLRSIGFLGMDGGRLKSLVDVGVVVPSHDYGPIEDIHMVFDHLITAYLRTRFGES